MKFPLAPIFRRAVRASLAATTLLAASLASAATSAWVFYDTAGTLQYQADARGNRIIDYSQAGYGGGGVAIPHVAAEVTVSPSGGDDTTAIQNAIDVIAQQTPDAAGFRGAVLLNPGNFRISAQLRISTSGVVLRGSGSGTGGTALIMAGTPFRAISIGGTGQHVRSNTVNITDTYVPAGARSFTVSSVAGFQVGDTVHVHRPVTQKWIELLDMDDLVRNGQPQTWISPGTEIFTDRVIAAISGNRITLDVPLTDNWDSAYLNPPGGKLSKYTFAGRVSRIGVENLAIIAPGGGATGWSAFAIDNIIDSWVRDIRIQDTLNSVNVSSKSKRVTIDNIRVHHTFRQGSSAAPSDFSLTGTQLLANNCRVTGKGNTWPFISQGRVTGPIVLLKCFGDDRGFGPHQRWATGLLCDLSEFPSTYTGDKAGIAYTDRGHYGSGHGWTTGWSVAWNVRATTFCIQRPAGSQNWGIGCVGQILTQAAPGSTTGTPRPNGIYDSHGTPVTPGSLYLAQLQQRLGNAGLNAIGYADVDGTPLVGMTPVAPPVFSPAPGTYSSPVAVSMATATEGATIRYTIDGSTPTPTHGTIYTGPVTVNATTAFRAMASKSGQPSSAVVTATYTVVTPDFALAASPASRTVVQGASTTFSATVSGSNGFGGSVNFSVSGLPAGAAGSFSPATVVGSGTSTLTVAVSASAPAGTYPLTVTATSGSLVRSAGVSLVIQAAPVTCVTATSNGTFNNRGFTSRTGTFTATFESRPSAAPINSIIGLSNGAKTDFTGFAAIVRFNPSGNIDARNGSAYGAASVIPYAANVTYRFRLVVNIPAKTYSIFVMPAGGTEITVGTNYRFRTEQASVTTLNNWAVQLSTSPAGANTVCDFRSQL